MMMPGGPLRILLVEDAEPHIVAISRAFEKVSVAVEIRVARSLREYRDAVAADPPGIALMDLNLPDGRSLDLLSSPPEEGLFPIVVMTSHGDEDTAVAAMKAGALDYVVKTPEAFADMPHTVDRVLREWQAHVGHRRAVEQLRDREARYRAVTETAADGFVTLDATGLILDVNHAYIRRSGYTRDELLEMRIHDLEAQESHDQTTAHLGELRSLGGRIFETLHRAKDGTVWQVEVDVAHWPIEGGLYFAFLRDITRRKRSEFLMRTAAEIADASATLALDDLLRMALDKIELITGSFVSFFHFVDSDQDRITLQMWSTRTLATMCKAEGKGQHYPMTDAGVWADCARTKRPVIHNDYASVAEKRGMPAGHATITRELTVPVVRGGIVTAVVGVGNKTTDYVAEDIAAVETLASMTADVALRQKTQQEFEHFFQMVPDLVAIASLDGFFLRLNPRWEEVLGYSLAELMAKPFVEFVHPDDRVQTAVSLDGERLGIGVSRFVNRYRTKAGDYRWLEWNATPMTGESLIFAAARDITERRQSEEALQRSQQWMDLHLRNTPLAVIEFDDQLRVIEWNPSAEHMFGYRRDEAVGRPFIFLVPDAAKKAVLAIGDDLLRNRGGTRSTNENVTKAGQLIMCEWFNTPLLGADGRVMGVASLVLDITARRSLESQLRESQKLEAVGQLAGGVAHDYNNILAAEVMTLGLLEERTDLHPEVRQAVAELNALADRAVKLTQQLLLFSRRSPINVRRINLNQVLVDLHKMLHRLIGEHIEFEFAGASELPAIQADAGMIEQIATNLCVNARDAMPKGGRLLVGTSVVDVGRERASTHPDARVGRFVCLAVTDTGSGIAPDVLGRIFEPFFTTKEKGKGTGLGLSTVFGIAKQHDGWVEVESTLGVGSSFRVLLPEDASPAVETDVAKAQPVRGGHEVILLVEDEPAVRNTITLVLKRRGYTVLPATDARDALRVWEEHAGRIDLLYSDMVMPGGMTGLDLAQQLKPQHPSLKVVISSGYSQDLAGPAVFANPDIVFLPKPVSATVLLSAIRASLDGVPGD
jgi:PAS domain S-box-containing protein